MDPEGAIAAQDCVAVAQGTVLLPQAPELPGTWSTVAVAGAWVAAGGPGSSTTIGGVEIFHLVDGTWVPHGIVQPPDAMPGEFLGSALAMQEGTLVVGAPTGQHRGAAAGYVKVYEQVDEAWVLAGTLLAPDGEQDDYFGWSAAIDGDVIVVGASLHDALGSQAGAAYVYRRQAGDWGFEAKLLAPDGEAGDNFGHGVAVDGSMIAVTALGDDGPAGPVSGSVRIFERQKEVWTQTANLSTAGTDFAVPPLFSISMVLRNGRLIATANFTDGRGALEFTRTGDAWRGPRLLTAREGYTNAPGMLAIDPTGSTLIWSGGTKPPQLPTNVVVTVLRRDASGWAAEHRVVPPGQTTPPPAPACRVATDGVHWAMVRSVAKIGGQTTSMLYVAPIPARDRDHDGLADDCEIASGVAEDCDRDGIIDDAQRPLRYRNPALGVSWFDGGAITVLGQPSQVLLLNHFTVTGGGTVRSLRYVRTDPDWVYWPTEGVAVVYLDPDGDGDPSDAVLLSEQAVTLEAGEVPWYVPIHIDPVEVGPVGTSFFVGLSVSISPGQPCATLTSAVLHRTGGWFTWSYQGLDLHDLSKNPPKQVELPFSQTKLSLHSMGLEAEFTDCDGSTRLDSCEMLEGVLADVNADGVPDVCQDPLADLNGDGAIDGVDLGLLLSGWGACPSLPQTCQADLDGDGDVGAGDLGLLLAARTP